jgi:two-component system chemotaxis response regulator CheB
MFHGNESGFAYRKEERQMMEAHRVLIVDDSRLMRQVLTDVVNADSAFAVAAAASDGKEAVQLALELQPDLIIMDLEMPRMNGLEALRQIMAVRPVPIIMMSAVTDNGIRNTIKALQYGAFDFVRKPDNSLHLDIEEVSRHLLERLHAAAATLNEGAFCVMPAMEESHEAADGVLDAAHVNEAAAGREEPLGKPDGDRLEDRHDPPPPAEMPEADRKPKADEPPVIERRPVIRSRRKDSGEKNAGGTMQKQGGKTEAKPAPAIHPPMMTGSVKEAPASSGKPEPALSRAKIRRTLMTDETGLKDAAHPPQPTDAKDSILQHSAEFQHIVVMGTSTGGPRALHEVLTRLPKDFEAPVLVVQHMPPKFTQSLAQRLDSYCALKVREAAQGDLVETGTVYIAPGGWHMRLTQEPSGKYRIKLSNEGPRNGHMPSVDVLFESLVGFRSLKRHAVLMTGMGSDGAVGMQKLQEDGSETRIAQSQETCIVYGMPGSAVRLGAANHVVPLQQIASVLLREIRGPGK